MMERTACFSGHRGVYTKQMEQKVYQAVKQAVQDGYTTFIHGGCQGFDILAAKQVIRVRKETELPIVLVAAIPFEGQSHGSTLQQREDYERVMAESDKTVVLFDHYAKRFFLERNRWMCERSQRLICLYNGSFRSGTGNTVRTAQQLGIEIINLWEGREE